MSIALLVPVYTALGDWGYWWETPNGRNLTGFIETKSAALEEAPLGYVLLDDAWQPIKARRWRREPGQNAAMR